VWRFALERELTIVRFHADQIAELELRTSPSYLTIR